MDFIVLEGMAESVDTITGQAEVSLTSSSSHWLECHARTFMPSRCYQLSMLG